MGFTGGGLIESVRQRQDGISEQSGNFQIRYQQRNAKVCIGILINITPKIVPHNHR